MDRDIYVDRKYGTGGRSSMDLRNSEGVKKLGKQGLLLTLTGISVALLVLYIAIPAFASTIVPISNDNAGAGALAEAMVKAPDTLQGLDSKLFRLTERLTAHPAP